METVQCSCLEVRKGIQAWDINSGVICIYIVYKALRLDEIFIYGSQQHFEMVKMKKSQKMKMQRDGRENDSGVPEGILRRREWECVAYSTDRFGNTGNRPHSVTVTVTHSWEMGQNHILPNSPRKHSPVGYLRAIPFLASLRLSLLYAPIPMW